MVPLHLAHIAQWTCKHASSFIHPLVFFLIRGFLFLPSFLLLLLPATCCSVVTSTVVVPRLWLSFPHPLYPVSSNGSSHDNNDNSEQHKICPSTIQSSLVVFAPQLQYRRHLFLSHQDMTFDQQTRLSPAAVAWGQQVWKLEKAKWMCLGVLE